MTDALILGLAVNHHDSCLALMRGSQLLEVVEVERLSRVKYARESRLAPLARDLLRRHGKTFVDVDAVATSLHGGLAEEFEWLFTKTPYDVRFEPQTLMGRGDVTLDGVTRPAYAVRHHAAHAAASLGCSPWADDVLILSFDGEGDYESFVLFEANRGRIRWCETRSVNFGLFFTLLGSHFYGLHRRGAAGTLMAYAALADPDAQTASRICDLFAECEQRRVARATDILEALSTLGLDSGCFAEDSIDARVFMASFQRAFEDSVLRLLATPSRHASWRRLCLSGGCALNCVANSRLASELEFESVFVPPYCHDGGIATGAAMLVCREIFASDALLSNGGPYQGRSYALNPATLPSTLQAERRGPDIYEWAAQRLATGAIIGWIQDRSEAGPRALGNRSILARPDLPSLAKRLNYDIKQREWYRPFAPVVLADHFDEFFSGPTNEFMSFAAKCKDQTLSGVRHFDGSARVQSLRAEANPKLQALINAFRDITGIPVLLNTSFNGRAEPIVETPLEAIRLLETSSLDVVVVGDWSVTRS